jgi:ADP-ribose pyrophosphatase YjhB (NUDIX family)
LATSSEEYKNMDSNIEETGFILSALYKQIMKRMPIASVEAVIEINGALLFLRRKNMPAMGQWWFPGGRIKKGESLEETLSWEIKEETGLELVSSKLINVYSRVFPRDMI